MKQKSAELVFIIDKSGSMSGLESDTIGGFNSLIDSRKKNDEEITVSTVLFDTEINTLHDRVPIRSVPKMTGDDYCPSGCTALLDAVGITISGLKKSRSKLHPADIPESTLIVITTDGYENSSREYSYDSVRKMIEAQKEAGWEFIFMGANMDAVDEASKFGISKECAIDYDCDSEGVKMCYKTADRAMDCLMSKVCLSENANWREDMDEQYRSSKGKSKKHKASTDKM